MRRRSKHHVFPSLHSFSLLGSRFEQIEERRFPTRPQTPSEMAFFPEFSSKIPVRSSIFHQVLPKTTFKSSLTDAILALFCREQPANPPTIFMILTKLSDVWIHSISWSTSMKTGVVNKLRFLPSATGG